jgi:hypothetical protein
MLLTARSRWPATARHDGRSERRKAVTRRPPLSWLAVLDLYDCNQISIEGPTAITFYSRNLLAQVLPRPVAGRSCRWPMPTTSATALALTFEGTPPDRPTLIIIVHSHRLWRRTSRIHCGCPRRASLALKKRVAPSSLYGFDSPTPISFVARWWRARTLQRAVRLCAASAHEAWRARFAAYR